MIKRKAPDFTLKDQFGKYFTLSENNNKYTLLVFYPKDDSFVCTKQLCNYNENLDSFLNNDIQLVGINADSQNSHTEFSQKFEFKFPLLTDTDGKVSNQYGVSGILGTLKRKLVLIDKEMNIIYEDTLFSWFYKKAGDILNAEILKK